MNFAQNNRIGAWALALAILLMAASPVLAVGEGYGPGRVDLQILAGRDHVNVGSGAIWNSRDQLHIQLDPAEGWRIKGYKADLGGEADYAPPLTPTGNPQIGHFDYKEQFPAPFVNVTADEDHLYRRTIVLDMEEDLEFMWGAPWAEERTQGVAIFLDMVQVDEAGNVARTAGAWVVPELIVWLDDLAEDGAVAEDTVVADESTGEVVAEATVQKKNGKGAVAKKEHQKAQRSWEVEEAEDIISFDGGRWGWWFTYEMGHPLTGHFIDAPVAGLHVETPTFEGITGIDAAFDYFPGETVDISLGDILLGSAVADQKVSPLDMFGLGDLEDNRVANVARLLQTLDIDGEPQGGIVITEDVVGAFAEAVASLELEAIDFSDDAAVGFLIDQTVLNASLLENPVFLVKVSAEDAINHLGKETSVSMFRKNVSKTPEQASSKAKMNSATMYFPAMKADDTPATFEDASGAIVEGIPYYDADGNLIRTATETLPMIVTYTDEDPVTGGSDTWAAVSRDDGNTWKRKNLSRTGDLSSFTLANGEAYYGSCKKPVFSVQGNKIMVAWGSKYAKGGKPAYAIDPEDDYTYDDPYYEDDIWGVGGPQRSHDYTEDGFPEVGELPYQALWTCRGLILSAKDLTVAPWNGIDPSTGEPYFVGQIVWYKPERLTSGRRDVNQIFLAVAGSAGFAMVWQEDPDGVKPGKAVGPGPGWGGATTSHKTDIWYSYLVWGDHSKVDSHFLPSFNDPSDDEVYNHPDVSNRPKALAPWSLPLRLSDNEVVNTDNILVELGADGLPLRGEDGSYTYITNPDAVNASDEADGTHRYATEIPGLISDWYTFENYSDSDGDGIGETKIVAVTEDGRLLDGDTGASRGNIFIQPYAYNKPDGSIAISAWAIITYEETKGAGAGPPDEDELENGNSDAYIPEEGKNVIYHSFDFQHPDLVAAGRIVNRPEFSDADGDNVADPEELVYLVDEDGAQILDYLGRPQLAYENARRGRFMPQGIGAFAASRTSLVMVHKQGPDGAGRPSDILLRRWEYPASAKRITLKNAQNVVLGYNIVDKVTNATINPYGADCLVGTWVEDTANSGQGYYVDGVLNMSSVTPRVTTGSTGDPDQEDAWGAVKVVEWVQTEANLSDPAGDRDDYDYTLVALDGTSGEWPTRGNPFDDARAHRGTLRGDLVTCGFSYCPNWAAARNGHDHFDFYIRRSYDGGLTWTTDPEGSGVTHCRTWTYPSGTQSPGTKVEECNTYEAGQFEAMRNLSQLPNHTQSVIEPRIVATPGTIKVDGVWTGDPEDKQDTDVFYVAYGTSTNPQKDPVTGEQDEPAPMDLWWSVTQDMGESYYLREWDVNPDSDGTNSGETVYRWDYMAKGDQEQGEVQLRETPAGSRFYACWLDEGEDGSDIVFRRIMPPTFPANWAGGVIPVVTATETVEELTEDLGSDASGDDGGDDD